MNKPVTFILFITGNSGSGKTTIYELLKHDSDLKNIDFHDIDENGIPQVGLEPWRKFRVEELYYNATRQLENNISSVICGNTQPHEVIESRFYQPQHNTHFLLLNTSLSVIRQRLNKRFVQQEANNIYNESFKKGSLSKILRSNTEFKRRLVNSISTQKKGYTISTNSDDIKVNYKKVKQLIEKISRGEAINQVGRTSL